MPFPLGGFPLIIIIIITFFFLYAVLAHHGSQRYSQLAQRDEGHRRQRLRIGKRFQVKSIF